MDFWTSLVHFMGLAAADFLRTYVDPDVPRTTCQIALARGYPCEIHEATTEDGYILELHRIPHGKIADSLDNSTKRVILLMHGFQCDSSYWVANFEKQSLGFVAADAGLDVWMGNVRGTNYSIKHVSKTSADSSFWRFTFDEMAKYDLPAMVEYILNVTETPYLYYVGHSQGTMIGFIQFSEDPAWAKTKIKQFHAVAPVVWLKNTGGMFRTVKTLVLGPLFESQKYAKFQPVISSSIKDFYSMLYKNSTRLSFYDSREDCGTSGLNLYHWCQLVESGKFQKLDSTDYHPNTSVVPTYLYWSKTDQFTNEKDVATLMSNLKSVVHVHEQHDYDHLDFLYSMRAHKDIYQKLLNFIKSD